MFGVGGKKIFYYLKIKIEERKGLLEEEGIKEKIKDLGGGEK